MRRVLELSAVQQDEDTSKLVERQGWRQILARTIGLVEKSGRPSIIVDCMRPRGGEPGSFWIARLRLTVVEPVDMIRFAGSVSGYPIVRRTVSERSGISSRASGAGLRPAPRDDERTHHANPGVGPLRSAAKSALPLRYGLGHKRRSRQPPPVSLSLGSRRRSTRWLGPRRAKKRHRHIGRLRPEPRPWPGPGRPDLRSGTGHGDIDARANNRPADTHLTSGARFMGRAVAERSKSATRPDRGRTGKIRRRNAAPHGWKADKSFPRYPCHRSSSRLAGDGINCTPRSSHQRCRLRCHLGGWTSICTHSSRDGSLPGCRTSVRMPAVSTEWTQTPCDLLPGFFCLLASLRASSPPPSRIRCRR